MRRLPRLVAETAVNKEVSVRLWRQGQSEQLVVVLGELEAAEEDGLLAAVPDTEVDERALEPLGLSLAQINTEVRNQYSLAADVEGVVITDVLAGSSAEEKGLRPGEVIVEVGQEKVSTPSDVARKIEEANEAGRRSVLLLVEREGDLRFVALSIAES